MKTKNLITTLVACAIGLAAYSAAPRAEEGFWPYNNIPRAAIKKKYGFEVTDAWLKHLQLATIRFGGGTGSIVSPDGLVLTNHHIALGSLQRLSTPERDLVKDGFVAVTRDEELKVPGMTLNVLQEIEDVTEKVHGAVAPGMSAADAVAARQKAIEAIQEGSLKATGMQSTVVSLYAGAIYNLYRYKTYNDVRLVFGAEYQTGFYGGDPDNFTYPRYNLDVGMFRLYENDKPAQTPNHLRWSPKGSKEGELVFTTGHPGATQRLNTLAHLQFRRDVQLPFAIASGAMREGAIKKWAALSPENQRQTKSELFGVQNSLKNQRYQLKGLQDAALMAKKEAEEKRLRDGLAKDAQRQQELGGAWAEIEQSLKVARQIDAERNFIVNAAGLNSQLFTLARGLVRAAYAPPAAQAAPAAGQRRAPAGQDGPQIDLDREKLNLTGSLAFMVEQLGADHAIAKEILDGKTPEARAAELVAKTRLTDLEIRNLLRAGGRAAIDVSTDPFIKLARDLEPRAQEIAKRYESEVTTIQAAAYPKIGRAVFVVYGPSAYPDATGTLRLSYGTVKSYVEDGRKIAPYTVMGGLYDRSAQNGNKPPYDLAPRWAEAQASLDLKTPMNLATTNDIVGGNSGSAMVNRKGEVVGLIFDGNLQMLPGYFIYEESVNRAVSVDSRAIIEALRKVYKAGALAEEIVGKAKA
ncbi:MAG TPA: S46 family peptidase [Vicinamibacterales bacterium]|nr:S46 family peptidase [Vicinamibacterales bacterium]